MLTVVMLVVAVMACHAEPGRADGDPASDVLLADIAFFPYARGDTPHAWATLYRYLLGANKAGYRIKVAVIDSPNDLGSVPELFNKPRLYAKYLGAELSFSYKGRLLVAMPAGFGAYGPVGKRALASSSRGLAPGRSPARLAQATLLVVTRLAHRAGFSPRPQPLPPTGPITTAPTTAPTPAAPVSDTHASGLRAPILLGVGGVLVSGAVLVVALPRLRRRSTTGDA